MNNDGALPGRDTLARRIASGLGRLALAIKAKAWRGASDEGITPTQGELLARLLDQPEGLRLGDLAVALGISAPTASDAVTTLVAKDLVERRAGTDKRSVTLRLTRSGRKMALKANDWTAFLAGSIESLPELEQAAFITSLIKIIRTMQDAGDISPQRMCVTCAHFRPFMHRGQTCLRWPLFPRKPMYTPRTIPSGPMTLMVRLVNSPCFTRPLATMPRGYRPKQPFCQMVGRNG